MCGHLSVADNIFIGRAHKRGIFIDDAMMHREAKKILDDLGIDLNTHTMVGELSVAQQQMVEIAKAISFNSKILVLDEPTATLTEPGDRPAVRDHQAAAGQGRGHGVYQPPHGGAGPHLRARLGHPRRPVYRHRLPEGT